MKRITINFLLLRVLMTCFLIIGITGCREKTPKTTVAKPNETLAKKLDLPLTDETGEDPFEYSDEETENEPNTYSEEPDDESAKLDDESEEPDDESEEEPNDS